MDKERRRNGRKARVKNRRKVLQHKRTNEKPETLVHKKEIQTKAPTGRQI